MKSGQKSRGFTIVETLIFLSVSAALLVSALTLIGGSQSKTQFTQAINDAQQQIDIVINNVANGYYPRITDVSCSVVNGTKLSIASGSNTRGTNEQCVFLGRIMQFKKDSDEFTVYSVAGTRHEYNSGVTNKSVKSMDKAIPTLVTNPATSIEKFVFKNGQEVKKITTDNGGVITIDRGAVGVFSSFGVNVSGNVGSSAQQTEFASIVGSALDWSVSDGLEPAIDNTAATGFRSTFDSTEKNPSGGIEICLDSGTTDQHGIITIGGNNQTSNTRLQIKNGVCT